MTANGQNAVDQRKRGDDHEENCICEPANSMLCGLSRWLPISTVPW
jgi:hypothetical protein